MNLLNALGLALTQIARNGRRSALTLLGVLIGVAAVVAMVCLGESARNGIRDDLSGLGQNLIFAIPGTEGFGSPTTARPFSPRDVDAIRARLGGVAGISAATTRRLVVSRGDAHWPTDLSGTDGEFFRVQAWELARGRPFDTGELRSGAPVAVLGETVARELFGGLDPIGEEVRAGQVTFTVIGVLASKGQSTFGMDMDDFLAVPLLAFQRRVAGNDDVGIITVAVAESADADVVRADLDALLRTRRAVAAGEEPDFFIQDMREVEAMVGSITGIVTALLAAVAAVSLLVGGIGIMNVMLVSVTERTREIGLRLAVGARSRDVLWQFLVEAVVLSTAGGVAGLVLGVVGSRAAVRALDLPFALDEGKALLALGFAIIVGLVFGFFPARRAARLDPIDALRHE